MRLGQESLGSFWLGWCRDIDLNGISINYQLPITPASFEERTAKYEWQEQKLVHAAEIDKIVAEFRSKEAHHMHIPQQGTTPNKQVIQKPS